MNRLALVQMLRQKVGGAGSGPTTTVNQSGETKRMVDWVDEAWNEIQTLSAEWRWMRSEFAFQAVANKTAYLPTATPGETGVADLAHWHKDTLRVYATALGRADEQFLTNLDYQSWRDTYDFGEQATKPGKPVVWAERLKDRAILIGPMPDGTYTVTGEYQTLPVPMLADADQPAMPQRFHMLVVYKAAMLYGAYEGAPEVYAEGQINYNRMLTMLELDQLEGISLDGALA